MSDGWEKTERWTKRAKSFCIEIVHGIGMDEHTWNVYAYIYPTHPHFKNFVITDEMWQDAANVLPLHGGPSLLKWHFNAALNPTSVQVGCDYTHIYDEAYLRMENEEDAGGVFNDADRLYQWLKDKEITV